MKTENRNTTGQFEKIFLLLIIPLYLARDYGCLLIQTVLNIWYCLKSGEFKSLSFILLIPFLALALIVEGLVSCPIISFRSYMKEKNY